jgi:tetratricopeptide (TPR) repeat protein
VTLGANYVSARQLDSARYAYDQALARPERLSVAEQYRLKGDVAYALDHDVRAAVKWYDLYLAEIPYSRAGLSNRALYRSAMGDYSGATMDLRAAVDANPFGTDLIQPVLLNLAAMQVVLGQNAEARKTALELDGPFATYVSIMLAVSEARWAVADSISNAVLESGAQGVFRINALTARAGSLAARGSVTGADSVLAAAAADAQGSVARWYERARLQLAIASGHGVTTRRDLVPADTTVAAGMLRSLWSAAAGDTAGARAGLARLQRLSKRETAIVGHGPLLIKAWIAADGQRWREVADLLARPALVGEHDPTILDRPDSFLLRWLVATAYQNLGKPDSSAVFFNLILQPTRIPPGHLALRGLTYNFARQRLAELQKGRGVALRRHSLSGGDNG